MSGIEMGSIQIHPGTCLRAAGLHLHRMMGFLVMISCWSLSRKVSLVQLLPKFWICCQDMVGGGAGMTVPDSLVLVQDRGPAG